MNLRIINANGNVSSFLRFPKEEFSFLKWYKFLSVLYLSTPFNYPSQLSWLGYSDSLRNVLASLQFFLSLDCIRMLRTAKFYPKCYLLSCISRIVLSFFPIIVSPIRSIFLGFYIIASFIQIAFHTWRISPRGHGCLLAVVVVTNCS